MLQLLTVIPPIPRSTMASSGVAFWVMIGLLAVLALVATILWVVGNRRIAQGQPQVKEAPDRYEALLEPQYYEQPHIHSQQEEMLLRR